MLDFSHQWTVTRRYIRHSLHTRIQDASITQYVSHGQETHRRYIINIMFP